MLLYEDGHLIQGLSQCQDISWNVANYYPINNSIYTISLSKSLLWFDLCDKKSAVTVWIRKKIFKLIYRICTINIIIIKKTINAHVPSFK